MSFVIGPDNTEVAVATFSEPCEFQMHFDFMKNNTKADIANAIRRISDDHDGDPLRRPEVELFSQAREDFPHILIVLIDGRAPDCFKNRTKSLRSKGEHIIAVGFDKSDYQELKEIASAPDKENVIMAHETSHSSKNVTGLILKDICKGEK